MYIKGFDSFLNDDSKNINEGFLKNSFRTIKIAKTLKKEIKDFTMLLIPERDNIENALNKLQKDKNATDEDYLKIICNYLDDDGILADDKLISTAQKSFKDENKDLGDIIIEIMAKARHDMAIHYSYKGTFDASMNSNAFLSKLRKQLAKADSSEEKYQIMKEWRENDFGPFYRESVSDVLTNTITEYITDKITSEKVITDIDRYTITNEKIDWDKMKKESDDTTNNKDAEKVIEMKKEYKEQQEFRIEANQLFDKYMAPFFEDLIYRHVMKDANGGKKFGDGEPLKFRLYKFFAPNVAFFYNIITNRERVYSFKEKGGKASDLIPRNNEFAYDDEDLYIMGSDYNYHYKHDLEHKLIKIDSDEIKDFSIEKFEDYIKIQPIFLQPTIDWCNENGIKYYTNIGKQYVWGDFYIIIDNDTINNIKNQH